MTITSNLDDYKLGNAEKLLAMVEFWQIETDSPAHQEKQGIEPSHLEGGGSE